MAKKSISSRPTTSTQQQINDTPPGLLEKTPLHLLIITLTALAAYANTFHVPFIFDDISSITENHLIKNLSTFLSGAGYAYNPRRFIGYLSFALNYKLGGINPVGYHIVNLAIHILNGCLVYAFVRLTVRTPFFRDSGLRNREPENTVHRSLFTDHRSILPLFAALLFVAHPVQTQAVTYIVQRLASLATLFYLLSMVLYLRARLVQEKTDTLLSFTALAFYLLSLVSALLAMRTKEIAATLPLVVVLFEFSFFGNSARKKLIFLLPLLLTIVIIPLGMLHTGKPLGELLSDVSEMTRESHIITRGEYLLTQFSVIATYIRLLLFPAGQNLDYDYPLYNSLFELPVLGGFVLICALVGLAIYFYYRTSREREPGTGDREKPSPFTALHRLIGFGILWFFITLAVESSIIPITDVIFEHRLYLPSVGAFIALAAALALFFRKFPPQWHIAAITVTAFVLVVATWQRNACWQSAVAIWTDVIQKSPKKYRGYDNLGFALNKEGKPAEAIEYLQTGIRLNPDNPRSHNTLGSAYRKTGQRDSALQQFLAAVSLDPNFADAHSNLGAAYGEKGLLDLAIEHLEIAVKLDPFAALAQNNLGGAYLIQGLHDKALNHFQAAVSLQPDNPGFHLDLANAYAAKGMADKAGNERNIAASLTK